MQLNNKSGSRVKDGKTKKVILFKSVNTIYERRELTSNAFKSKIFAVKPLQEKWLKIWTIKQMLQSKFLIAIASKRK